MTNLHDFPYLPSTHMTCWERLRTTLSAPDRVWDQIGNSLHQILFYFMYGGLLLARLQFQLGMKIHFQMSNFVLKLKLVFPSYLFLACFPLQLNTQYLGIQILPNRTNQQLLSHNFHSLEGKEWPLDIYYHSKKKPKIHKPKWALQRKTNRYYNYL